MSITYRSHNPMTKGPDGDRGCWDANIATQHVLLNLGHKIGWFRVWGPDFPNNHWWPNVATPEECTLAAIKLRNLSLGDAIALLEQGIRERSCDPSETVDEYIDFINRVATWLETCGGYKADE